MLRNRERIELVALMEKARACLTSNHMTPSDAFILREHGETLAELERARRVPAYGRGLLEGVA